MIFHQVKDWSIGRLDLFAIDVLQTGDTKDAVLPEAIATAVTELVVDHVRDKLLRGLNRNPILRWRKQSEPSRATTKDAIRCMRLLLEMPAGTRTLPTSQSTGHISMRSSEKRVGIPAFFHRR